MTTQPTIDPHDSAFTPNEVAISREYYRGLTKREYMATHILAGMMANESRSSKLLTRRELAFNAVKNTDALIAELNLVREEDPTDD